MSFVFVLSFLEVLRTPVIDLSSDLLQWAILGIRNMCEGNIENQKVVQSLKQEGLAPSARKVLDQFSSDGEKLTAAVLRITNP